MRADLPQRPKMDLLPLLPPPRAVNATGNKQSTEKQKEDLIDRKVVLVALGLLVVGALSFIDVYIDLTPTVPYPRPPYAIPLAAKL
jgi:hypothetical protein